ncbi:MAG: hypothetical protein IBJ11_11600 [Phycisphaerales bacterium]|nr:hypothetical protein [Phycisphaerales bacterium]
MAKLRIEKVYLDVVSERGDAAVVYAMDLWWGPLRLAAASILLAPADERAAAHTWLGERPVREGPSEIGFESARAGVVGRWAVVGRVPGEFLLYEEGERAVRWACLAPAADAALSWQGRTVMGRGYAERLTMTIEPWRLPIDLLRWGRYAGPDASVVWISWHSDDRPDPTRRVLLVDGEEVAMSGSDDQGVWWDRGRLMLEPVRTLRDQPLAGGPVAAVARLVPGLPVAFLRSHETKWLSRAVLAGRSGAVTEGFALHEAVRFAPVRA